MAKDEWLSTKLDVDKETLRELITDIVRGHKHIFLPQFQRTFEWDEDDAKKLLDSIIRNLPIGSIILWKPSEGVKDPFAIPLIDINTSANNIGEFYYLLDGQQRLTCLLLLYNQWKITRGGEDLKFNSPIFYIPARNKLIEGSKEGIDLSKLFNAYLEGNLEMELKDYINYKRNVEDLVRRIVNYEVPVYTIKTYTQDSNTIKDMAEAFIRINKAGIRIGMIELMLSFIAGTVSGEFSRRIRMIYKSLENYGLELNVLIRFVLSNFGVKQTVFSNVEQFKSSVGKIKFDDEVINKSEAAINQTMELLKTELGLNSCRLIPSQIALIPIAAYIFERDIPSINELSADEFKSIANWFMIVNMQGYYSSSTNSKLQKDLDIIRKKSKIIFPYQELLNNIGEEPRMSVGDIERGNRINILKKQGMPYTFLLYVLLVKEKAEDLDGKLISSRTYSELEKHHIFPQDLLEDAGIAPDDPDEKEAFISGLGNITWINAAANKEILKKPPEEYLYEYPPLQKHFIPEDKELLKLEMYEEFKQKRVELICDAIRKHFTEILE